jgi:hypothetical protein
VEATGDQLELLLGHPSLMGFNGPTHDFSFSFFITSKPRNNALKSSDSTNHELFFGDFY